MKELVLEKKKIYYLLFNQYVLEEKDNVQLDLQVGKNYLCAEWKQELITFSEFLQRIESHCTSGGPTYLAQHPLFDQVCTQTHTCICNFGMQVCS